VAHACRYLVEGIVTEAFTLPVLLWGKPSSGSPRSDDGGVQRRSPLWGNHFWSIHWLEVALWLSGMSLLVSTTVGLGGMASWSLNGGHVLRCARRAVLLSSVMVALMVGPVRGFALVFHSGDGLVRSG
jgi:hypothetical protein